MQNQTASLSKGSRVLFVHYGDNWLRGSEHCLLDIVNGCKNAGLHPIVWCNSEILASALLSLGVTSFRTDMEILLGYHSPRFSFKAWLFQVKYGARLIKRYSPAIVHINSGAPAQWMTLACKITRTPFLVHLHAHYGVLKDRLALGIVFCQNLVGVSHAAIRAFEGDGIEAKRLHILPNALNTDKLLRQKPIPLKRTLGLNPEDKLLLSVGSLIKRKGHEFLLSALFHLKQCGEPIYAAIIGDGPERDDLIKLCHRLGLQNHVFFLGERPDAFGYMRGDADALVSTAVDEVFGLVLAEANLAKLPVIAPNIPGINSVISNEKTGLLYKPGSTRSLQQKILRLNDKTQVKALTARGYHRAQYTFNGDKYSEKLLALYQHCINKRASSHYTLFFNLLSKGVFKRCQLFAQKLRFLFFGTEHDSHIRHL